MRQVGGHPWPVAVVLVAACATPAPTPAAPLAAPAGLPGWPAVTHLLDSLIADGVAPGAVVGVSYGGQHWFHGTGHLGDDDATVPDSSTVYDLASLTKVIGLTTAVMLGLQEQRFHLDDSVVHYLPRFGMASSAIGDRSAVTLRHLLTHSSGLPAWRPLYQETATRADAFALADTTPLDTLPGTRFVYSDLGAIVLTQIVEHQFGQQLDSLLAGRLFTPLGMADTRYLPPAAWLPRIAPTEADPWRGRVLRGEVHDENAARLDGVSGHAGLFSSARDLVRFGDWILAARAGEQGTGNRERETPADRGAGAESSASCPSHSPFPVPAWLVRQFTARQDLPPGSSRALGWDTPSGESSAGNRMSAYSFGHTGFTGTSIWIDPSRCLAIVILSNRVHPTRTNARWGPVRALVANAIVAALPVTPP
ncbi:MAG: serine hydrolase domain-containing protein [Gemmatimonadales bacterium]